MVAWQCICKMATHLLMKYKYPPEDYEMVINTVISQCEIWSDNMDLVPVPSKVVYGFDTPNPQKVAE